jgi:hypothetical protein
VVVQTEAGTPREFGLPARTRSGGSERRCTPRPNRSPITCGGSEWQSLGVRSTTSTFSEMMAPYKHAMAVGIAAQGAEIVIKARIAQEHPLLLFNQLPKSVNAEDMLTVFEPFEYGRTVQYSELPEVLWATTGIRMSGVERYQKFGRLRNATVHFAARGDIDLHGEALRFLFEVMEPLVPTFWSESMVPYAAE